MNDPYLNEDNCFDRLRREYIKYDSLVVAVDYDGVINDCHGEGFKFPLIIELLKQCNDVGFKLVIFSASPEERWQEIWKTCLEARIKIEGINCDVIKWHEDNELDYSKSKIFYNVFLDDRCGLSAAYNILKRLVDEIVEDRDTQNTQEHIDILRS